MTVTATHPRLSFPRPARPLRVTRRHLQLGLGLLWLLDAALQFQPFMFTRAFPQQVIAGAANGQPHWAAAGAQEAARLMSGAPAAANAVFAALQLALAAAILSRRTARFGLLASIGWSGGVWYFGESLGGLAGGHATLIAGAPGAAVLYALLAVLAWPRHAGLRHAGEPDVPASASALAAWAVVWAGGAMLQLLPGQDGAAGLVMPIRGSTAAAPGWLASADDSLSRLLAGAGRPAFALFAAVLAATGVAVLARGRAARVAVLAGVVLAAAFWLFGQNFGGIGTGQGTDPNSGPLLALLGLAVLSAAGGGRPAASASPDVPAAARAGQPATSRHGHPHLSRGSEHPMTSRKRQLVLLTAVPLLVAGCAATQPAARGSASPVMSPGMSMSPGMPKPGSTRAAAGPSASARMICSAEIRADVATLFALRTPPPATSSWAGHLYTCTYQLPAGRLVLSVRESPDVPSARRYFTGLRRHLGVTQPLSGMAGLGLPAYEADGAAVFLKDDKTLEVNATALPPRAGPTNDSRTDLAYTLATDVLACWTGK